MFLISLATMTVALHAVCPMAVCERTWLAMGTRFSLHLEGRDASALKACGEAALVTLGELEAEASTWRPDSAWSRLNQAQGLPLPVSERSLHLLARALHWQRETGGAFDPVLGSLVRAWGLREGGRVPDPESLQRARRASGAGWLELDPAAATLRLGHPEAALEEGGFLKGAALDAVRQSLSGKGVDSGLLDFGGQLLCWGAARRVELADPSDRGRGRLMLRLENASLSTSGCSERGRHLLDPRTGRPSEDWGAVAVVTPSALDADVLSTALFVMGPEAGFTWAEARNLAACFLPHQGPSRMTSAFQALQPVSIKESK